MTMANIAVVKGNIVRQTDCDGVINSANPNLRAGSGFTVTALNSAIRAHGFGLEEVLMLEM